MQSPFDRKGQDAPSRPTFRGSRRRYLVNYWLDNLLRSLPFLIGRSSIADSFGLSFSIFKYAQAFAGIEFGLLGPMASMTALATMCASPVLVGLVMAVKQCL